MKLSKQVLVDNVKKDILDNSVGAVSPQDIRRNLLDIIDSISTLTEFNELNSVNFSTLDSRTTRIGIDTLSKRTARGYNSADNVAVGYAALKSQIDGKKNTALGSFALTCNMYGEDNVGVGHHALGSTINGFGNVGLGSFSLSNNKEGSFNIALGHGAGYYVNRNNSYQLYIAAHPVDEDYICTNADGTDLLPLIRGDMTQSSLRLGVGVRDLHDGSTLQVGGNIHPSVGNSHNLGGSSYRFKNLYLTSLISFPDNHIITYSNNNFNFSANCIAQQDLTVGSKLTVDQDIVSTNGGITVAGDISANAGTFSSSITIQGSVIPDSSYAHNIGNVAKPWRDGHFYNVYAKGIGQFKVFNAEQQTHFRHKTLHLASKYELNSLDGGGAGGVHDYFQSNSSLDPNTPQEYLVDELLNDAGFMLGASGVDYQRTYELTFRSKDVTWGNLSLDNAFSRNSWFSNISIATAKGAHVKTDRIINNDIVGMFTYDYDLGLFLHSGIAYLSEEDQVLNSGLAGLGDVNFIASEKELDDYTISIQAANSGVNLFQTFLDNTIVNDKDSYDLEKITGFKSGYISDSELDPPSFFNEQSGQRPNRYIISSYNDSSFAKRCFTLLQDKTEGYVGISNFDYSESMLPDTILNVRSTGNAVCRITAENNNDTEASVELLGSENCQKHGVSLQYIKNSGVFNLNTFSENSKTTSLTISDEDGSVAILNRKMASNATLAIGDVDNTNASISMFHSDNSPVAASGYGQVYTRYNSLDPAQSSFLSFIDASGNIFNVDMTASSDDGSILDKPLTLDNLGNTFAGFLSPASRLNLSGATHNTAVGNRGLNQLISGSSNTTVGSLAGRDIVAGENNVLIGSNTVPDYDKSYRIAIGTDIGSMNDYEFSLGHGNNLLLQGSTSPDSTVKYLQVNTKLNVMGALTARGDIQVEYGKNLNVIPSLALAGGSSTLLTFEGGGMSLSTGLPRNYLAKSILTKPPTLEVRGDLKIAGDILFGNGTSLVGGGEFLADIQTNADDIVTANTDIASNKAQADQIQNDIDNFVIEGFVEQRINFSDLPNNFNDNPLEFYIRRQVVNSNNKLSNAPDAAPPNQNLILVTLRDPYLSVRQGDYVIAMKVNGEYRPVSITGAP